MISNAILDAGPLVSWFDTRSKRRGEVIDVLGRSDINIILPALPLAEAFHLVETRFGPEVGTELLEAVPIFPVVAPTQEDLRRMVELTRKYRSYPLGAADASIVALAERLDARMVITFDQRHFRSIRPNHVVAFELLPG